MKKETVEKELMELVVRKKKSLQTVHSISF